jgi:hypothetical protein
MQYKNIIIRLKNIERLTRLEIFAHHQNKSDHRIHQLIERSFPISFRPYRQVVPGLHFSPINQIKHLIKVILISLKGIFLI